MLKGKETILSYSLDDFGHRKFFLFRFRRRMVVQAVPFVIHHLISKYGTQLLQSISFRLDNVRDLLPFPLDERTSGKKKKTTKNIMTLVPMNTI